MSAAPAEFGRIYRRKNRHGDILPDWYIRVRQGDKEVTLKGGPTRRAASKKLRALLEEVQRQERGKAGDPDEMAFNDFASRYLEGVQATCSATTYPSISNKVKNLLVPHFGPQAVKDITKADVARFVAGREGSISLATRNRDLSLLSSIFEKAIALGYASGNPVAGLARSKEPGRPVPYVDPEGQDRLIEKCPDRIRPLVTLALDTGMRQGELLELQWRDVDLGRNVLIVRSPKNKEPREVPLTERARSTVESLRPADHNGGLMGRVLHNLKRPLPGNCVRMFKNAVEAANLPALRFHDLRHLHAASLVRAGVPLPDVGKLLGHKTLAMTMRYSNHAPEDAGQRAMERLQAWRKGGPPDQVRESAAVRRRSRRPIRPVSPRVSPRPVSFRVR